MPKQKILQELLALSHHLGDETRDYVIIGEGNASARFDDKTFYIKTSGHSLKTLTREGVVQVNRARVLQLLERDANDEEVTRVLMEARVHPKANARPSVETTLHAVLYELTDANFIGHTHASAPNMILCSEHSELLARHIMPDAVIVLGPHMVFVPYTDPGVPLTREVYQRVQTVIETHREFPRVLWLENHGLFALGQSAKQVENVTQMAVKHARVMAGMLALGKPRWLSDHDIARLHTRPDEEVRRVRFK